MSRRGFTLIELMVVCGVVAVVLAVMVPVTRSWLSDRNVAAMADQLVSDIQKAASEARTTGITPSPTPGAGGGTVSTVTEGSYKVINGKQDVRSQPLDSVTVLLCPKMTSKLTGLDAGRAVLFLNKDRSVVGGLAFNPNGQADPAGQIIVKNANVAYRIDVQVDVASNGSLLPSQTVKITKLEGTAIQSAEPKSL